MTDTTIPLRNRILVMLDAADLLPPKFGDGDARALGEAYGRKIGEIAAPVIINVALFRGLFKAAREDRPAKAIAYAVLLVRGRMPTRAERDQWATKAPTKIKRP